MTDPVPVACPLGLSSADQEKVKEIDTWRVKVLQQVWTAVLVIVLVVIGLGIFQLYLRSLLTELDSQVDVIRVEQQVGRENGYKNRAVACDAVAAAGQGVPAVCEEPEVRKYRTPGPTVP